MGKGVIGAVLIGVGVGPRKSGRTMTCVHPPRLVWKQGRVGRYGGLAPHLIYA